MKNEVLEQLNERSSVRLFSDEEVSEEIKSALLTAAVNAPTAGNQQLYTILDITESAIKQKLSILCDNQPFIATAPIVLVFLADCKKWYDAFVCAGASPRKPEIGDLMLSVSDSNIAAQNVVTAAHSLGLGSCYIGDIMENCEEIRKLLKLPKYVFPAVMLVIGYPKQKRPYRNKPQRVDMNYIVHNNTYNELSKAELENMLLYKSGYREYEDWIKAFCERKYNSDFSKEMSRSTMLYLQDFISCKD